MLCCHPDCPGTHGAERHSSKDICYIVYAEGDARKRNKDGRQRAEGDLSCRMIGAPPEPDECHERCSADHGRCVVRGQAPVACGSQSHLGMGTDEDCLEDMVRGNRKRAEKPCCIIMGPGVKPGRYQGLRLIDEVPTAMKLAGIPYDEDMLDGRSFF